MHDHLARRRAQYLPEPFIQIQLACREFEPGALRLPGINLLVQSHGWGQYSHTILQFLLSPAAAARRDRSSGNLNHAAGFLRFLAEAQHQVLAGSLPRTGAIPAPILPERAQTPVSLGRRNQSRQVRMNPTCHHWSAIVPRNPPAWFAYGNVPGIRHPIWCRAPDSGLVTNLSAMPRYAIAPCQYPLAKRDTLGQSFLHVHLSLELERPACDNFAFCDPSCGPGGRPVVARSAQAPVAPKTPVAAPPAQPPPAAPVPASSPRPGPSAHR